MQIPPVKFQSILKHRIWGGEKIGTLFAKDLPQDQLPIGECWELVDLPEEQTIISNGMFDKLSFRDLLNKHGQNLGFNEVQAKEHFGLLIKFIDAADKLSVQVHPDSDICKLYPQARSKTECWYIMHAEEGATIFNGLRDGVTKDDFEKAIKEGTVKDKLVEIPVKSGDFFQIPAGRIHALGTGTLTAEIGTQSDTTYRVFDWNRVDKDGNSRDLHIQESLDSINFTNKKIYDESAQYPITKPLMDACSKLGEAKLLTQCPFYTVAEITAKASPASFSTEVPMIVMTVAGSGKVYNTNMPDDIVDFKIGESFLIPAMDSGEIELTPGTKLLVTCPGFEKP